MAIEELISKSVAGQPKGQSLDKISCPICFKVCHNLGQLNGHLDVDHGFGDLSSPTSETSDSIRNDETSKNKTVLKKEQIAKNHWKKYQHGKSFCHECDIPLSKTNGIINCRKCGELFCKRHCRNIIKLNLSAQYDPRKGRWYICCNGCFRQRPGYNDYGSVNELTDSFKKLRDMRNEDKQLRVLQLENRLVRLVDGIIVIMRQFKNGIFVNLKISKEVSKLERTITAWKDDRGVLDCYICMQPFGITVRKHHCRLCGNIVCDSESKNCSNQVPVSQLVNAASDLPFKEKKADLTGIDYSIRLCSVCIKTLYVGRKFKRDLNQPLPLILSRCESLHNTSQVISNILPLLNAHIKNIEDTKQENKVINPDDIEASKKLKIKLLRAVASYNTLARQLSSIAPKNNAEKKIQQSVQMASAAFLNDKILRLKTLPGIIQTDNNYLPESDAHEVTKLSDIMFNNLSIREVKKFREDLMVLKEQKYLVESMIKDAKKQRKFDEIAILDINLNELKSNIEEIQDRLGDQGFA